MWTYAPNFAHYQKTFGQPSRGIYRVYSHTEQRFVADSSEKQGQPPAVAVRPSPGPEVIDASKKIVIDRIAGLLASPQTGGDQKTRAARPLLTAEACNTSWTPAYHDSCLYASIACYTHFE